MSEDKPLRSWPLYVLAAPATVAVWSGWVGLGEMTGFGKVHPLPGIADTFTVNTAITLPIGVEAYAAYALGAWLTRKPLADSTRDFARASSIGALVLGMLGQVAYHLLEVNDRTQAPTWITTIVACFPVLVLGMGATLAHLIHRDARGETGLAEVPTEAPVSETEPLGPVVTTPWGGLAIGSTAPAAPTETFSPDRSDLQVPDPAVSRSETQSADQVSSGSDPKVSDPPAEQVPDRLANRSADPDAEQVPDPGPAKPRTRRSTKAQTGPRKRTRAKPKPLERIDEAISVDKAYLAEHGRHIPAEKLAKALGIGKPAALDLVKQVRGGHIDIAK